MTEHTAPYEKLKTARELGEKIHLMNADRERLRRTHPPYGFESPPSPFQLGCTQGFAGYLPCLPFFLPVN